MIHRRAIQLIPTWQGLDGFQKCSLDESRLGIGIVTVPLIELLKECVFGHLCL